MINTINKAIAKRREEGENDKGFTLIELLVVVLIIGILAAIAIPAFLSQREGAWRSQIESDINSARIAAETYATNNNGSYSGIEATYTSASADTTPLVARGYKVTDGVSMAVTLIDSGKNFQLVGTNTNLATNKTITYNSKTGKTVAANF